MDITHDTPYHALLMELVKQSLGGVDPTPTIAAVRQFVLAHGRPATDPGPAKCVAFMQVGPDDAGLTLGEIVWHIGPEDADFFANEMVADPVRRLAVAAAEVESTLQALAPGARAERLEAFLHDLVLAIGFSAGTPPQNPAELDRIPTRPRPGR